MAAEAPAAAAAPVRVILLSRIGPDLVDAVRKAASEAPGDVKARLPSELDIADVAVPGVAAGADANPGDALDDTQRATLADATIVLADPPLVASYVRHGLLPRLQWMQSTWAGVDALVGAIKSMPSDDTGRDTAAPTPFRCTKLSGVFGPAMSDYVCGWVLALERGIPTTMQQQRDKVWSNRGLESYRLASELTVGVLGAGDIGATVLRTMKRLGCRTVGYKRVTSVPIDGIDELSSDLPTVLRQCDYIVNVLPSTPATAGALDGDVLRACEARQAVFINMGRGDIVSEDTLVTALDAGWIRQAVLDVFAPEPPPASSRLWTHPKVHITPHIAGVSRATDTAQLFVRNLAAWCSGGSEGGALHYEVDWEGGY